MHNKKGFTLIELLVVIAIIGILTAIVLASLTGAKSSSRDGKRISDVANLSLALESYFDVCKQYPPTLSPTEATGCPSGSGIRLDTFIPSIPTAPLPGTYIYELKSGSKDYCLGAKLENVNSSSKLDQCNFTDSGNQTNTNHRVKP